MPRLVWTDKAKRDFLQSHYRIVDECWIFTGSGTRGRNRGYLPWGVKPAKVMYELYVGPVPADYEVAHLCHQAKCINPGHLKAMSHQEHVDYDKSRETCANGHPRNSMNTYLYRGASWCRVCRRIAYARRKTQKDTKHDRL